MDGEPWNNKDWTTEKTYVKQLYDDTGLATEELKTVMKDDVEENC